MIKLILSGGKGNGNTDSDGISKVTAALNGRQQEFVGQTAQGSHGAQASQVIQGQIYSKFDNSGVVL